jgi:hypothetical protein
LTGKKLVINKNAIRNLCNIYEEVIQEIKDNNVNHHPFQFVFTHLFHGDILCYDFGNNELMNELVNDLENSKITTYQNYKRFFSSKKIIKPVYFLKSTADNSVKTLYNIQPRYDGSLDEVKDIVKYLADAYRDELIGGEINLADVANDRSDVISGVSFDDEGDDDELYEQAKEEVINAGKASTSYIQRKLRVGYSRAARLMDLLEQNGVIGPSDGAKAREVIIGNTNINTETDPPETEDSEELEEVEHKNGDYL